MENLGNSSLKVAEYLLQIKAIKLNINNPFTWASGMKSPIYCDNRKTLSYPTIRNYLRQEFISSIENYYGSPDVIAGVATGGIALGALIADHLGKPFIYVRSSVKEHGLQNKIEGELQSGQSVVVIEDLISTGKSSLDAVKAIREAGGRVTGLAAIFTYGFDVAQQAFNDAECRYFTLTDYRTMLIQATNDRYIDEKDIETLDYWRIDPKNWGENENRK
jgi:orotate phosphoribosyltransferase